MGDSISQYSPSQFDDGVGWRDLFGADFYALKDCIATPYAVWTIHLLENFFHSSISRVHKKPIGFCESCRSQEIRVPLKGRTSPKADATEDALHVRGNLLSFIFHHSIFGIAGDRFSVKVGFYFPIVVEKRGHVHNKISDHGEERERLNKRGFSN